MDNTLQNRIIETQNGLVEDLKKFQKAQSNIYMVQVLRGKP